MVAVLTADGQLVCPNEFEMYVAGVILDGTLLIVIGVGLIEIGSVVVVDLFSRSFGVDSSFSVLLVTDIA